MSKGRRILPQGLLALAGALVLLIGGCGKGKDSSGKGSDTSVQAAPAAGEQTCFNCAGAGQVPCRAPGCVAGKVECTGPCLRLTRGTWIHMNVPGHSPNELWIKFSNPDGRTSESWNQNHVGEVITFQQGRAVNIGKCKVCGGTTRVNCPVCHGEAKATCPICKGQKTVPASWKPNDNPWLNSQPDLVRLKSGRILLGKLMTNGTDVLIKTRDGKFNPLDPTEL